jgi:hypothetical protein
MAAGGICGPRLETWLWLLPIWFGFMFVYGILIETRVFGELIPLIVCATVLIVEEGLLAQITKTIRQPALELAMSSGTPVGAREAA